MKKKKKLISMDINSVVFPVMDIPDSSGKKKKYLFISKDEWLLIPTVDQNYIFRKR